jgi:hypothetical protein
LPEEPGELAYLLYAFVVDWVLRPEGKMSYSRASQAIGVLDTVKDEFRRRYLDPYEDTKIAENGDVSARECFEVALGWSE